MEHQNSIQNIFAPKDEFFEPSPSSEPILAFGYELRLAFIAMIWEWPFSEQDLESPYDHLQKFEQLCSCLLILGMTWEMMKW